MKITLDCDIKLLHDILVMSSDTINEIISDDDLWLINLDKECDNILNQLDIIKNEN